MELFKVKKAYRALARRLRRPGTRSSAGVERAESELLEALLRVERYESEVSVLRFSRRCAHARLSRTLEALDRSALFKDAAEVLARLAPEAAVEAWADTLERRGFDATMLREVLAHVRDVEARLEDLEQRLRNSSEYVDPLFQRLLNWVHADGLLRP